MIKDEKQQIAARLKEYCEKMGSQNKAARSLNGISTATVSKMLTGQWDTISDELWRGVAAQIGHDTSAWQIVKTGAYRRVEFLMEQAKDESLVIAITGFAGCGKTEAIKSYAKGRQNVYHLMCSEYWNRPTFINKLLRALGKDVGGSVSDQMDCIVETLNSADAPLVILDEADKLRDQVPYFFISLYNQLEGHCGIIMVATEYLKNRIERGVRLKKKGYEEIYSRIGRKFVQLQVINGEDIAAVCKANGVTDAQTIQEIIAGAECDLRRVKRAVWAAKKKGGGAMIVQMSVPAKDVSAILVDFIKENLPFDITVRTGSTRRGQRRVCFTINGSTQEDIHAKIDALDAVISKYQLRGNIEQ